MLTLQNLHELLNKDVHVPFWPALVCVVDIQSGSLKHPFQLAWAVFIEKPVPVGLARGTFIKSAMTAVHRCACSAGIGFHQTPKIASGLEYRWNKVVFLQKVE